MFKCIACEKNGKTVEFEKACSLGTHLWKTHGWKPQEYYDKYLSKPGDGKCAECGQPTSFRSIGQGYKEFCSKKCAARHIAADAERNAHKTAARQATVDQLNKETDGEYNQKILEARKATMLDRHGVEFFSQRSDFKDIYHQSNLERYGVTSYMALPEFQQHLRECNKKRIGQPYQFCKFTEDAKETYAEFFKKHNCELVEFANKKAITYKCNVCGRTMTEQDLFLKTRVKLGGTICSFCKPKDDFKSIAEDNLRTYVESLGFTTAHYDRNFLGEYGADIVVDEKKVIIEYDGIHWHSELYRPDDYHLKKTELAESAGYHLIHVFSDEWEKKQDIVKSRIKILLGCVDRKIYARNCDVREIDYKTSSGFLNSYHIQGSCTSANYLYGLYHEDQLVAVMTFCSGRFSSQGDELLRYCTIPYVSVIGGAGKLFKHFVDEAHPTHVVSYADRRWSSNGAFYEKLGFKLTGTTDPSYSYIVGNHRENRMAYQKYKLVAEGYDARKTEHEIMLDRGIYRIYDCGNYRYEYEPEATDAVEK